MNTLTEPLLRDPIHMGPLSPPEPPPLTEAQHLAALGGSPFNLAPLHAMIMDLVDPNLQRLEPLIKKLQIALISPDPNKRADFVHIHEVLRIEKKLQAILNKMGVFPGYKTFWNGTMEMSDQMVDFYRALQRNEGSPHEKCLLLCRLILGILADAKIAEAHTRGIDFISNAVWSGLKLLFCLAAVAGLIALGVLVCAGNPWALVGIVLGVIVFGVSSIFAYDSFKGKLRHYRSYQQIKAFNEFKKLAPGSDLRKIASAVRDQLVENARLAAERIYSAENQNRARAIRSIDLGPDASSSESEEWYDWLRANFEKWDEWFRKNELVTPPPIPPEPYVPNRQGFYPRLNDF